MGVVKTTQEVCREGEKTAKERTAGKTTFKSGKEHQACKVVEKTSKETWEKYETAKEGWCHGSKGKGEFFRKK